MNTPWYKLQEIEIRHPFSQLNRLSPRQGTGLAIGPALAKGEIVQAKVLGSYSMNHALLLLKGEKVNANTHVPLPEGSVLSFKVQEVSPIPVLRIIGTRFEHSNGVNSSLLLNAIKQNLWKTVLEDMPNYGLKEEALTSFQRLMGYVMKGVFVASPPELLRELIDRSGFRWEAKLREALRHNMIKEDELDRLVAEDLKGFCSRFVSREDKEDGPLGRLISTIQSVQLLNEFGIVQKRMMFFPIPFQSPDGLYTVGQLLIQLPQKDEGKGESSKREGKDVFRVAFLLELSLLGPLRADLVIKGKEVWGTILFTNEEAKLRVEDAVPSFVDRMKKMGLLVHSLDCKCRKPNIVTRSLLTEIIQQEGNTINLIA
jgi:hypothetical protein